MCINVYYWNVVSNCNLISIVNMFGGVGALLLFHTSIILLIQKFGAFV